MKDRVEPNLAAQRALGECQLTLTLRLAGGADLPAGASAALILRDSQPTQSRAAAQRLGPITNFNLTSLRIRDSGEYKIRFGSAPIQDFDGRFVAKNIPKCSISVGIFQNQLQNHGPWSDLHNRSIGTLTFRRRADPGPQPVGPPSVTTGAVRNQTASSIPGPCTSHNALETIPPSLDMNRGRGS